MKSKQQILLVLLALSLNIVSAKLYPKKDLYSKKHILFSAVQTTHSPSEKMVSQIDCDFESVKNDYKKSTEILVDNDDLWNDRIPVLQEYCPTVVLVEPKKQNFTDEQKEHIVSCHTRYNVSIVNLEYESTCTIEGTDDRFECNVISNSFNETHYDNKLLRVMLRTKWIEVRPLNEEIQKVFDDTIDGCLETMP